jgi:hypothetical protein
MATNRQRSRTRRRRSATHGNGARRRVNSDAWRNLLASPTIWAAVLSASVAGLFALLASGQDTSSGGHDDSGPLATITQVEYVSDATLRQAATPTQRGDGRLATLLGCSGRKYSIHVRIAGEVDSFQVSWRLVETRGAHAEWTGPSVLGLVRMATAPAGSGTVTIWVPYPPVRDEWKLTFALATVSRRQVTQQDSRADGVPIQSIPDPAPPPDCTL